ncbi:hypothetical protein [Pedobacter mendelii]|uniref:hypothetical protein n=1 Tax=Pedobacter mendelii TaxID=1908240 RepID=UPI00166C2FDD|nr:hypothetical protein [Pedobacter mendelii]
MGQGRTPHQLESSNKMMVSFLIALVVFVLITYAFDIVERKSTWLQSLEHQMMAK